VLVATVAGCFWRTYGARAAMHTDLLVAMTRKGTDLVRARRFAPENLPELYYPLERALAFAAGARRRSGEHPPESLVALEALLGRYEAFCHAVDELRRGPRTPAARRTLRDAVREVDAAATTVRRALAAEGRG
jgi:hypothetical protein